MATNECERMQAGPWTSNTKTGPRPQAITPSRGKAKKQRKMSAKKASMGTFQPLRHRSGTMRDRLHNYTKRTLGAGGSMNEAVSSFIFDQSMVKFENLMPGV